MKGIPSSEKIWITVSNKQHTQCLVITSKEESRSFYYAYAYNGQNAIRLGRGRSPVELEEQYFESITESLCGK